jgi:hypothetical protein
VGGETDGQMMLKHRKNIDCVYTIIVDNRMFLANNYAQNNLNFVILGLIWPCR